MSEETICGAVHRTPDETWTCTRPTGHEGRHHVEPVIDPAPDLCVCGRTWPPALDLDALDALAAAATPGPWRAACLGSESIAPPHIRRDWTPDGDTRRHSEIVADCMHGGAANARLIAAARTAVPALVARVRELTGALAAQEERDRKAAARVGVLFVGCDTSDMLAERVREMEAERDAIPLDLRLSNERLRKKNHALALERDGAVALAKQRHAERDALAAENARLRALLGRRDPVRCPTCGEVRERDEVACGNCTYLLDGSDRENAGGSDV